MTPAEEQALQEARDAKNREKEEKAPTTKTGMGEGKLEFPDFTQIPQKLKDLYKKATGGKAKGGAVKKMARGGGVEIRGKTKGRIV